MFVYKYLLFTIILDFIRVTIILSLQTTNILPPLSPHFY